MQSQTADLHPISGYGGLTKAAGALVPAPKDVPVRGTKGGAAEDGKTHDEIIAVRKKLLANQKDVQVRGGILGVLYRWGLKEECGEGAVLLTNRTVAGALGIYHGG
jgi:hypothetical protein